MGGRLQHCLLGCLGSSKAKACNRLEGRAAPRPDASINWGDLPTAVLAQALSCLDFQDRCKAALVCRQWCSIINSAAAHARDQSHIPWPATRTLPYDVDATSEQQQLQLQQCRAIRYAPSAALTLNEFGFVTLKQLSNLTRLVLLDPVVVRLQQQDRDAWSQALARPAVCPSLQQLTKLQVLSVAMSSPLLHPSSLPSSLHALHLDLASGYSVQQLSSLCSSLCAAASHLPHLQHLSLASELDALMSSSQAVALSPLSGLTQLTSLSLVEYQYMHPDSAAHEGYVLVPPVLQQLPRLHQAELHLNSGHQVDLLPAAALPDVSLVITLAHYEQTPFNRLPPSLPALSGLTSLSILMAEFTYQPDADLYFFDVAPLAACTKLRRLLLELHGVKSSLHDLRGLPNLQGLTELVVLLKCPDVHEARPEATSCPPSIAGSTGSSSSSLGAALLPAGFAEHHGSQGGGVLGAMHKVPGLIAALGRKALLGDPQQQQQRHVSSGSSTAAAAAAAAAASGGGGEVVPMGEEWVLALLDHALDQLRPEFALTVPVVAGKLLIATTCRLLLRQPGNLAAARQPLLLASHIQLDLDSSGDFLGGESFLHPMGLSTLRSWAARQWAPLGVELLPAARYPVLGSYPGSRQRIDDKLLAAARRGVSGAAVVAELMATVESRCVSYFI